jgi:hypothetical protein
MSAPIEEEHLRIDESGYEEDDEGGAHIRKNRTSRNSGKSQSRQGRGVKRAGSLRDSLVLKEHRWTINDPFVVDPTESIRLDALDVTKCALKSVLVNYVEGTLARSLPSLHRTPFLSLSLYLFSLKLCFFYFFE